MIFAMSSRTKATADIFLFLLTDFRKEFNGLTGEVEHSVSSTGYDSFAVSAAVKQDIKDGYDEQHRNYRRSAQLGWSFEWHYDHKDGSPAVCNYAPVPDSYGKGG